MDPLELQKTLEARFEDLEALERTLERNPRATIWPARGDQDDSAAAILSSLPQLSHTSLLRFQGTLGEGGMGVVRLATQASVGRKVAVKTLKEDHRSNREILKLLREAWVAGMLEHPNVVPVYDVFQGDDGVPCVVLKHIEGVDWAELLRNPIEIEKRFGAKDILEWNLRTFLQVVGAVHYAHRRGIVHRDLKPENVMIGAFGEVYVVDWGLAVAMEADGTGRLPLASEAVEMAGTPSYMAPEMIGGEPSRIGPQTDIYLLGATLYEVLIGAPPHVAPKLVEMMRNILASRPSFDPSVPPALAQIVLRAMEPLPEDRFGSAAEMREAIEDFLRHRGAEALALSAAAKLGELDLLAHDVRTPIEARRARVTALFAECRFGFEQALRAWPSNELAAAGLERAIARMEAFERESRALGTSASVLGTQSPRSEVVLSSTVSLPDATVRSRKSLNVGASLAVIPLILFVLIQAMTAWISWEPWMLRAAAFLPWFALTALVTSLFADRR